MSASALRPVPSQTILTALRKLGASITDDNPDSNFVSVVGRLAGAVPVLRASDRVDPLNQMLTLGALGYTQEEFLRVLPEAS
jgi:hypothetical protein